MKILLCLDLTIKIERVPSLLDPFNLPSDTQITILGIRTQTQNQNRLEERIQNLTNLLTGFDTCNKQLVTDSPVDSILNETAQEAYDLSIISDTGFNRGFSLFRHDSTAIKLAKRIEIPLLIIRREQTQIKRILFCTSAEEAARQTFERSISFIKRIEADITIMHVMSQVTLQIPGVEDDLLDTAESHISRQTREGKHLTWAVKFLSEAGISGPTVPLLRHGLVLDEVNAEVTENKVDLLIIGAHHRPERSRLMEFLLEDVARDLLREVTCSVLLL